MSDLTSPTSYFPILLLSSDPTFRFSFFPSQPNSRLRFDESAILRFLERRFYANLRCRHGPKLQPHKKVPEELMWFQETTATRVDAARSERVLSSYLPIFLVSAESSIPRLPFAEREKPNGLPDQFLDRLFGTGGAVERQVVADDNAIRG